MKTVEGKVVVLGSQCEFFSLLIFLAYAILFFVCHAHVMLF